MFKAYDRVNLKYLGKVLLAMNFPSTFVDWILMLHRGAKTRLILDSLTDAIEVLFSVRQGDPLSMLLYIIYIEPLLLMLEKRLKGFPLESPLQLGPSSISFEGAREKSEGFVDDTEAVITNDKELLIVDEILREFEQMSGAIVNRSKKCKIMGLGGWKSRTEWPLDYFES